MYTNVEQSIIMLLVEANVYASGGPLERSWNTLLAFGGARAIPPQFVNVRVIRFH